MGRKFHSMFHDAFIEISTQRTREDSGQLAQDHAGAWFAAGGSDARSTNLPIEVALSASSSKAEHGRTGEREQLGTGG